MLKVGWFNELTPEQKLIEEKIFSIVKKKYQQFWYTPIETPAVEKNEVLTAKWWDEVSKQIFWVYGLAQWSDDLKKYSLHFDLTVPFARYVIDHRNDLTFPFKRSQIQKVWRWERQQRWRSREFYQADIDVIYQESDRKYLFYDAEVISIWYKTYLEIFKEFDLDLKIKININNKKIIFWFLLALWLEDKFSQIAIVIDNKEKISKDEFKKKLFDIVLDEKLVDKIIEFLEFDVNYDNLDNILNLIDNNKTYLEDWIKELKQVLENIYLLGIDKEDIKINFAIIRWLDYYTWTIFETFIDADRKLWSIASWWKYENFTQYLDKKTEFSWVWFSMWITRFEDYLFEKLDMENALKTTTEYLFINFEETKKDIFNLFNKFILDWKNCEIYPESIKIWKQIKYADKKGIKYIVILWEQELKDKKYIIKNLETWENKSIDF